ncbi:zinc ribbon domain-containing protein [Halorubrum luteum]
MGEIRRRRPWLAVLLALVISGLGHAYLRRWGRALGWYVTITATVVFLVPDSTIDQVFAGTTPPLGEIAPALIVVVASVIDAYVLAVRNNRKYERQQAAYDSAGPASTGPNSVESASGESPSGESLQPADCPHCGREIDPDLDFCHWCTERLPTAEEPHEE